MIKLAVFDWNGTLFDDVPYLIEGMNKGGLALLGLPPISLQTYQEKFTTPLKNFYIELGASGETFDKHSSEIGQAFEKNYEPLALQASTRPGALELLASLAAKDVTSVILSNHTVEGIYIQLARLGLEEYIAVVLANDAMSDVHHKGKQDRLADHLQTQGINPDQAIIVGDSIEETRIAQNLGLHSIAITGGACTPERLKEIQPDYIISTLGEILNIVEGIA